MDYEKFQNINIISTHLLLLNSCVKTDDFELPEMLIPEIPAEGNITTIDAVKGHFNFNTNDIYTLQGHQYVF
jgi:hypothetical protein